MSKQPLTPKETEFIAAMRAVLKTMPRGVCIDWDTFENKLEVLKRVRPGEGRVIAEIKVRSFS